MVEEAVGGGESQFVMLIRPNAVKSDPPTPLQSPRSTSLSPVQINLVLTKELKRLMSAGGDGGLHELWWRGKVPSVTRSPPFPCTSLYYISLLSGL